MIEIEPIGFANTLLPAVLLGGLSAVLPLVFVGLNSRSHQRVSVAIVGTAVLMIGAGACVMMGLYALRGVSVGVALAQAPVPTGLFFVERSAPLVMIWGPVLALVWLGLAQRVERLRSQDQVQHG